MVLLLASVLPNVLGFLLFTFFKYETWVLSLGVLLPVLPTWPGQFLTFWAGNVIFLCILFLACPRIFFLAFYGYDVITFFLIWFRTVLL